MQHGMDAVMNMGSLAMAPATAPAGGAAAAPNTSTAPRMLPNTGAESNAPQWTLLALAIGALLVGGFILRRRVS